MVVRGSQCGENGACLLGPSRKLRRRDELGKGAAASLGKERRSVYSAADWWWPAATKEDNETTRGRSGRSGDDKLLGASKKEGKKRTVADSSFGGAAVWKGTVHSVPP